jgi:hypothetical protein
VATKKCSITAAQKAGSDKQAVKALDKALQTSAPVLSQIAGHSQAAVTAPAQPQGAAHGPVVPAQQAVGLAHNKRAWVAHYLKQGLAKAEVFTLVSDEFPEMKKGYVSTVEWELKKAGLLGEAAIADVKAAEAALGAGDFARGFKEKYGIDVGASGVHQLLDEMSLAGLNKASAQTIMQAAGWGAGVQKKFLSKFPKYALKKAAIADVAGHAQALIAKLDAIPMTKAEELAAKFSAADELLQAAKPELSPLALIEGGLDPSNFSTSAHVAAAKALGYTDDQVRTYLMDHLGFDSQDAASFILNVEADPVLLKKPFDAAAAAEKALKAHNQFFDTPEAAAQAFADMGLTSAQAKLSLNELGLDDGEIVHALAKVYHVEPPVLGVEPATGALIAQMEKKFNTNLTSIDLTSEAFAGYLKDLGATQVEAKTVMEGAGYSHTVINEASAKVYGGAIAPGMYLDGAALDAKQVDTLLANLAGDLDGMVNDTEAAVELLQKESLTDAQIKQVLQTAGTPIDEIESYLNYDAQAAATGDALTQGGTTTVLNAPEATALDTGIVEKQLGHIAKSPEEAMKAAFDLGYSPEQAKAYLMDLGVNDAAAQAYVDNAYPYAAEAPKLPVKKLEQSLEEYAAEALAQGHDAQAIKDYLLTSPNNTHAAVEQAVAEAQGIGPGPTPVAKAAIAPPGPSVAKNKRAYVAHYLKQGVANDEVFKLVQAHFPDLKKGYISTVRWELDKAGLLPGSVKAGTLGVKPAMPLAGSAPPGAPAKYKPPEFYMAKKVGEAKGSNPGGFFVGQDGVKRYIKFYPDAAQASGEALSNEIYRRLGIGAAESEVFLTADGKTAIASKIIESKGTVGAIYGGGVDKAVADKILDGFAADVLTANWDAVGTGFDNVVVLADGSVARIDQGGTLLYRAKAGKKQLNLLDTVTEWEGFAQKNQYYKAVFQAAGVDGADALGERVIAQIERIRQLRASLGPAGWQGLVDQLAPGASKLERSRMAGMLEARTTWLENRVATIQKAAQQAAIEKQKLQAAVDEFNKSAKKNGLAYKVETMTVEAAGKLAKQTGTVAVNTEGAYPTTVQKKHIFVSKPPPNILTGGSGDVVGNKIAEWYSQAYPQLSEDQLVQTVKAVIPGAYVNEQTIKSYVIDLKLGKLQPAPAKPDRPGVLYEQAAAAKLDAHFQTYYAHRLSATELASIRAYGGSSFNSINGSLRDAPPGAPIKGSRHVPALDKAMAASALPEDTLFWRGIRSPHPLMTMPEAELRKSVGTEFTEKGYGSHSTSQSFAEGWGQGRTLRVTAPKGTKGVWMRSIGGTIANEREFLWDRASRYKVTGVSRSASGKLVIDVEYLCNRCG